MIDYADPRTPLEAALYYASLGLSVLPVQKGGKGKDAGKRPPAGFHWKELQERIATEDEIRDWFNQGNYNLGIVCGSISDNLVVWDIDVLDFANWIEPLLPQLKTWAVRSGSGKLHVFFRTPDPLSGTVQPGGRAKGNRLADIKGEGGYVVAAPSIHASGGQYETVYGSPENIRRVVNLSEALNKLRLKYMRAIYGIQEEKTKSGYADNRIAPPMQGLDLEALRKKVLGRGVAPRIRRAILQGGTPGIDEWHQCSTHSEIDYAVCASLIRLNWGFDEIEEVFASFPLGKGCYRNKTRPNHGVGYLQRTFDNVKLSLSEYEEARAQDMGLNFRVIEVRLLSMENSIYELVVEAAGVESEVQITYEQLFMQQRCIQAIGNSLNIMPRLNPDYQGKNWPNFVDTITKMAQKEEVPLAATNLGQIRQSILAELKRPSALLPNLPDNESYTALGFHDPSRGRFLFRGAQLIRKLDMVNRNATEPTRIWQILRKLGAIQTKVKYPRSGFQENLWMLPESILNLTS